MKKIMLAVMCATLLIFGSNIWADTPLGDTGKLVFYVDVANGDDSSDGLSMQASGEHAPFKTIKKAITQAQLQTRFREVKIYLNKGDYKEAYPLVIDSGKRFEIVAYQNSKPIIKDFNCNQTAFTITGNSTLLLKNLEMQGVGSIAYSPYNLSQGKPGILVNEASLSLEKVKIIANNRELIKSISSQNLEIKEVTLEGKGLFGLFCRNSMALINRSVFKCNYAAFIPPGADPNLPFPIAIHSVGIYSEGGTTKVINSLTSSLVGFVSKGNSIVECINCTNVCGLTYYIFNNGCIKYKNCVNWPSAAETYTKKTIPSYLFVGQNNTISGTATYAYCNTKTLFSGEGNISSDPKFVDMENQNYQISTDSVCCNSGVFDASVGNYDLEGKLRVYPVNSGHIDMGCYEFIELAKVKHTFPDELGISPLEVSCPLGAEITVPFPVAININTRFNIKDNGTDVLWTKTDSKGTEKGTSLTDKIIIAEDTVINWSNVKKEYKLDLVINGTGSVSGGDDKWFFEGENVELTAVSSETMNFDSWSGSLTSSAPKLSLTFTPAIHLKANFKLIDELRPPEIALNTGGARVFSEMYKTEDVVTLINSYVEPEGNVLDERDGTISWSNVEISPVNDSVAHPDGIIVSYKVCDTDSNWAYAKRTVYILDPDEDEDGDGLTNSEELTNYFSNPLSDDSDGDGILDSAEDYVLLTINNAHGDFKYKNGTYHVEKGKTVTLETNQTYQVDEETRFVSYGWQGSDNLPLFVKSHKTNLKPNKFDLRVTVDSEVNWVYQTEIACKISCVGAGQYHVYSIPMGEHDHKKRILWTKKGATVNLFSLPAEENHLLRFAGNADATGDRLYYNIKNPCEIVPVFEDNAEKKTSSGSMIDKGFFFMRLNKGLNLISFPITPDAKTFNELFTDLLSTQVTMLNASKSDLISLDKVYKIQYNGGADRYDIPVHGTLVAKSETIDSHALTGMTVDNIVYSTIYVNNLKSVASLWSGENSPQGFVYKMLSSGEVKQLSDNDIMKPGEGYLLKSSSQGVLKLGNSSADNNANSIYDIWEQVNSVSSIEESSSCRYVVNKNGDIILTFDEITDGGSYELNGFKSNDALFKDGQVILNIGPYAGLPKSDENDYVKLSYELAEKNSNGEITKLTTYDFHIDVMPPVTTVSHHSGAYTGSFMLELTCSEPATIYYIDYFGNPTLDINSSATKRVFYDGVNPVKIPISKVWYGHNYVEIQYAAKDLNGNIENTKTERYWLANYLPGTSLFNIYEFDSKVMIEWQDILNAPYWFKYRVYRCDNAVDMQVLENCRLNFSAPPERFLVADNILTNFWVDSSVLSNKRYWYAVVVCPNGAEQNTLSPTSNLLEITTSVKEGIPSPIPSKDEIINGFRWLANTVSSDGMWMLNGDKNTKILATTEALNAYKDVSKSFVLHSIADSAQSIISKSLNSLRNCDADNTDYLARKIITLRKWNEDVSSLVKELKSRVLLDSASKLMGAGVTRRYDPDSFTSALVREALNIELSDKVFETSEETKALDTKLLVNVANMEFPYEDQSTYKHSRDYGYDSPETNPKIVEVQTSISERSGKCLRFDGVDDSLAFEPHKDFTMITRPFEISFWVNFDKIPELGEPYEVIMGQWEATDKYWRVLFDYEEANKNPYEGPCLKFFAEDGESDVFCWTATPNMGSNGSFQSITWEANKWYHVRIVMYENHTMKTFVKEENGTLYSGPLFTAHNTSGQWDPDNVNIPRLKVPLVIGSTNGGSFHLSGMLDDICLQTPVSFLGTKPLVGNHCGWTINGEESIFVSSYVRHACNINSDYSWVFEQQNNDTASDAYGSFAASIMDTAAVLNWLDLDSKPQNKSIAVNYLKGQQEANGSWEKMNSYVTALVLRALLK